MAKKYYKSNVLQTNLNYNKIQLACKVIGYYSLIFDNIKITQDNLERESARIERCVEFYYLKDNNDLPFFEFVANFLKKNKIKLIEKRKGFSGLFLSDVPDLSEDQSDKPDFSSYSLTI